MARAEFDRGDKIRGWEKRLDNPDKALKQIGALMVAESEYAFREQGMHDKRWPERAEVNVFGIIADLTLEGRNTPPKRRFDSRPALKDTGRLARSIAFRVVSTNAVEVGTNLEYAAVHNFGGTVESKPITETVQKKLAKWLRGKGAKYRDKLGFLLSEKMRGEKLEMDVPKRQFVGITKQTIQDVAEAVGAHIFGAG